jgi:hypothetical protein
MKGRNTRNQSSSHSSTSKEIQLPKSEWCFDQVPDHLVHHCWLWEFCRELYLQNEELRGPVEAYWLRNNAHDDWRRHVKHKADWPQVSASAVFTEKNIFVRENLLGDDEGVESQRRFLTNEELFVLRDNLLHLPGLEAVNGYATAPEEVILRLRDFDETYGFGHNLVKHLAVASVDETDRLVVCVDWSKSDEEQIREFRKLLIQNRPNPRDPKRVTGKPSTPKRNDLKNLGAFRLHRHYGSIQKVFNSGMQHLPFSDEKSVWSKASKAARQVLQKLTQTVVGA